MQKSSAGFAVVFRLLIFVAFLIASCTPAVITSVPQVTLPTKQSTPTEIDLPVIQQKTDEILLFSVEEDGYAHLFQYKPAASKMTRITSGAWDDITPAANPDGTAIAFASNRTGYWDLYLLDLISGELTQLTDTPAYEGAPTWSPDGSFLAYEAYLEDNLEIVVGPANDPAQDAVQLTTTTAADHSPAWAPDGRHIAYISDGDVILADLDKTDATRFTNLSKTDLAVESHPVWSPEGQKLAWGSTAQNVGRSGIYIWDSTRSVPAEWLGDGNWPVWNAAGDQILTTVPAPNNTYLTIYSTDGSMIQSLTPFPGVPRGLLWAKLADPDTLPTSFEQAARLTPAPLWAPVGEPISEGAFGRWSLVNLDGVLAPFPQMHDLANEAFDSLRGRVQQEVGWDALASLENAFVPITTVLDPGFNEDWLYTGRAFAINSLMTNAGWMVAVREDYGSQTYWRLYLRAQAQDGSLGEPLRDLPWDLSARYNLDPKVYEQGGTYSAVPGGYWVDVTSLASQYGWERVPALPNWQTFYKGARFTEFVLTGGLDWYSAMLELYPPDVLVTPTRVLPPTATSTNTPIPTRTPLPTRTPRPTFTPSPTRTPTSTPTASSTPPTVVP